MKQSLTQVLITGVYRTGSEYLTQLLNTHPQLSATMYRVNMLRFMYKKYDPIHLPEQQKTALDDLSGRLKIRYNVELNISEITSRLKQIQQVNYGNLYDAIMTELYLKGDALSWAEKCQLTWRETPDFTQMMPNGKVIIIVRDPRSVLSSFKKFTYAPEPAYLGAIFNCFDCMKSILQFEKQLNPDQFTWVRYEDIARNPQKITEKLWDFIGLSNTTNVHTESQWLDAYGNPWVANSSFTSEKSTQPFDVDKAINRWKLNLEPFELQLTEGICGDLMSRFGYENSSKNLDWQNSLKPILSDTTMTKYYQNWVMNNEGIQAFPTDPLIPKNWKGKAPS